MSIEYIVRVPQRRGECFPVIAGKIRETVPAARISDDGMSLWIPEAHSAWILFSIEQCDEGFFVVSNLNGREVRELFSLMIGVFDEMSIEYEIEDA